MAAGTECADFTGSLDRPTTVIVGNSVRIRLVSSLVASTRKLLPMSEQAALTALDDSGLPYRVIRHGPVSSLAEAAQARGVEPSPRRTTGVLMTAAGCTPRACAASAREL